MTIVAPIVDQLGLQLYQAGLEAGGPSPSTRKRSKFWKAVAQEALRQMEWARSEGMDGDRDKPYEVTLAPPDWKP